MSVETVPLMVDHENHASRGEFECPKCIEHIEQREEALRDLQNAEKRIRALERRVRTLEADKPKASRQKKNDDQTLRRHIMYPQAQEVFAFWKEQVSPRAQEFSGKRLQNTIARLEAGYTAKQLKLAVYGAARHPTTLYGTTYNDLELVCRDPAKTDDFMARGTRALQEDKALGLEPAECPKDHAERRKTAADAG